jgi:dTMP kinase
MSKEEISGIAGEKTYFLTFEGIDCCGKDTQLHRFAKLLRECDDLKLGNKYSNIWVTNEPTKITNAGKEIIKHIYSGGLKGEEAAKLFVRDRIEHTAIMKDVLKHSHVLCGRYDLSTLAYQRTQGMDFETLYKMHDFEGGSCLVPDLTLVFDIPIEVAIQRKMDRNKEKGLKDNDFYERSDFQKKLIENLHFCVEKLKEKGRNIIIINGNQSINDVTQEMLMKVNDSRVMRRGLD